MDKVDKVRYNRLMGYVVRKIDSKRRSFKVQFATYAGDQQKVRDIPEDEWLRLGFRRDMTLPEAQARRDQLNAVQHLKQVEEKRTKIQARLSEEALVLTAYLNPLDVAEFERDILFEGFYGGDREANQRNKVASHWRAAMRVLNEVRLEPEEWADRKKTFYGYFAKHAMSPSYLKKLVRILNLWGKFVSRKRQHYFEPLPYPTQFDKERIADKYLEKKGGRDQASDPIYPKMLEKAQSKLQPEHYHWLLLTVWFGLRPIEVESLKSSKYFRIETHQGKKVLFVYQSKLKGIAHDKRWKYIPCLQPEQVAALKVIEEGSFKRPLCKTVHAHFGEHTTLYGGRKGFEFHMSELGYRLEDISMWLGHRSIERTWRNYKEMQKVRFPT